MRLKALVPVWIKQSIKTFLLRYGWLDPGGIYVFFTTYYPPDNAKPIGRRVYTRAVNKEAAMRFLVRRQLGVRLDRWVIDGPHPEALVRAADNARWNAATWWRGITGPG